MQRGSALVELAAASILLSTLVIGFIEIGRGVQQYAALTAAARAAARYVATHTGSIESLDRAKCLATVGRALTSCAAGGSLVPAVPGLMAQHVVISLPRSIVDDLGNDVVLASSGLASIQAVTSTGEVAGTLDLVTVTISPKEQPLRFEPLLPGLIPRFHLGPVSASMPVVAN